MTLQNIYFLLWRKEDFIIFYNIYLLQQLFED